jgi:hypothetical protein
MQVIPFNNFIIKDNIKNHIILKPQILSCIERSRDTGISQYNTTFDDEVSKLDWDNSKDNNREWVKLFLPVLGQQLNSIANNMGFKEIIIRNLWYQQYVKNNKHGWHIHGSNCTGIYYLELPENAPRTQLVDPVTRNVVSVDVCEGDLILFPSFTIHRAPIVESDLRKTIISFNIDFLEVKIPI